MTKPVYGIFEGGGAKGIGHIAGIKAAERSGFEFVGVAGASAGALIAALVAVGYHAGELFDPDNPASNLLQRHGISPLALLGEPQWKIFQNGSRRAGAAAKALVAAGLLAARLVSPSAVRLIREIEATGGFFTTENVRSILNDFLRNKLRLHHANAGRTDVVPERVRFCDIDPAVAPECCSLKVIVTDVTNRRMVVFGGGADFALVEVAEAVAASIAIPAVFKPARIPSYHAGGDALYADGGMVSNLPVWVFSEEKLNYERSSLPLGKVPVLAFSLGDLEQETAAMLRPGSVPYWAAAGRAGIFGGQTVAQRFAADLQPVPMPIRLGVTEFDLTTRRVLDGYNDAYAAAARIIVRETQLLPQRRAELLADFHDHAARLIHAHASMPGACHLRVGLIQKFGDTSFRVTDAHNMAGDADDRLVFSRFSEGAPEAFSSRNPALIDFRAAPGLPRNMTKYEYAMLRRTLHTAICLPVFADPASWQEPLPGKRPPPLGVVSVDCDQDLAQVFNDKVAMQALAAYSLGLSSALQA